LSSAVEFSSGVAAREVERELFRWIRRDLRLPYAADRRALPSGYSETFPIEDLSERQLRYRLTMASRRHSGQRWSGLRDAQRLLEGATFHSVSDD
jgi:hypothetical protein